MDSRFHVFSQRPSFFGESMLLFSIIAFCSWSSDCSLLPWIASTALAMNRAHPDAQLVESFMDETFRGKHTWAFELDAVYKRAPGGGILYCSQCGCLNELMQSQVQGECEYGASFEHEGRLLWKSRLPRWGQSFASMTRGIIRAQTNVQQILGVMHQDGLPKRAIRTARRLLLVYRDESEKRCRTRADSVWCDNWTAHKRNVFLKEFGDFLPLLVLLLARRLKPVKRWRRFCMDKDDQRRPKKLLRAYPREYRGKLRALVADIRNLDPEVWHKDWNWKKRHELCRISNGTGSPGSQLLCNDSL
jgi:hypothetical protein